MKLACTLPALLCLCMAPAFAQDEVPFITTPDHVTLAMLEMAGVKSSDHVIDLGSGDGRIVITAAKRFGASGLGVELVPDLVRQSRDNARQAGVAERTEFLVQDLFATDLSRATVVTLYLLPDVNLQLRPRLLALAPGTRIVSHDWDMGDWPPERSQTLSVPDKAVGRDKQSRVHLWVVPAQVQGLWCAADARLHISQRFQAFSATLTASQSAASTLVWDGRIDGNTLRATGARSTVMQVQQGQTHQGQAQPGRLQQSQLQILSIEGPGSLYARRTFERAQGANCP